MQKQLKKLGFTPNEATVYVALLESGQSPTGILIKKTGLHRNIVYECLDAMVKRHLVTEVVKDKKKHFRVASPRILLERAEENLKIVRQVVTVVEKKSHVRAPEVIIYEGRTSWQEAHVAKVRHLARGAKSFILGAGGDKWVDAMGDAFITYERICREKNIGLYMIAYEWQREEIVAHQGGLIREVRYLPKDYGMPSNTEVYGDGVFIQIFSDPLILIDVRSREVADGYLQHFNSLWEVAKK